MKEYINLLRDVLEHGEDMPAARPGMPSTKEIFGTQLRFDLRDGFPAVTTKKLHYKGVVAELLWMLRGETNIKSLVDEGVNIWNADAYKFFLRKREEYENSLDEHFDIEFYPHIQSHDDFVNAIRNNSNIEQTYFYFGTSGYYKLGDLGKIYGWSWRETPIGENRNIIGDQIGNLIKSLRERPESRAHFVSAWHPFVHSYHMTLDMVVALPPCHTSFQVRVIGDYIDLMFNMRSSDLFLGLPYNIAFYATLQHILAKIINKTPRYLIYSAGSSHIYENHFDAVKEQISREPRQLPKLSISDNACRLLNDNFDPYRWWDMLLTTDFSLVDYDPHPKITAELSVGV